MNCNLNCDSMKQFLSIYSNFGYISHSNAFSLVTFRKLVENCKESNDCTMIYYLISFVAHVRDISTGKGQRTLSYAMLYILYDSFPTFTTFLFYRFLDTYGSLRDCKGLCRFFSSKLGIYQHPLIDIAIHAFLSLLDGSSSSFLFLSSESMFFSSSPSYYNDTTNIQKLLKWIPNDKWIQLQFPQLRTCVRNAKCRLSNTIGSGPIHSPSPISGSCENSLSFGFYIQFIIQHSMRGTLSNTKKKWILRQWNSMISSFDLIIPPHTRDTNSNKLILPVFEISNEMTDGMMFNAIGLVCAIVQIYGATRILGLSHVPFWISSESIDFIDFVFHLWSICSSRTFCYWDAGTKLLEDAFQYTHACDNDNDNDNDNPSILLICRESPPSRFAPTWLLWSLSGTSSVPSYSSFSMSGIQCGLLGSISLFSQVQSQHEFVEKHLLSCRYWPLHQHVYDSIGSLGSLYI